jgi:hypothetical protein
MMVYPQQNPGPELVAAAHPELENIHYVETTAVLEDPKVAEDLHREILVLVIVVVAAAILLFLLL